MTGEPPLFSRWERDTRYYELHLRQDLWGDWLLTRVWGRRGTSLGQIRHVHYADYGEGASQYADSIKQRSKRGYVQTLSIH
ncbi:MAG: WGR domain-containing protein [Methylococcaceae bacterium]